MKTFVASTSTFGESMVERRKHAKTNNYGGKRALVRLRAEDLTCDLFVRSFNVSERTVTYEMVVFNKSRVGVSCRVYGLDATLHTREFGMLTVAANSAGNSFLSAPLDHDDERRRIFVEAVGIGVNVYAEAIQPAQSTGPVWPKWTVAGALLAGVAAGTVFLGRPSIEAFTARSVTSGNTLQALYTLGGIETARYRASFSNGVVFAQGLLPKRSGELRIAVPSGASGAKIRLAVEASGPFGRTTHTDTIQLLSPSMDDAAASVKRGSDLPAITGLAAATASSTRASALFTIPHHVVAGRTFDVIINRPMPGLRLTFKDDLEATVDEVSVGPRVQHVTLAAPASPTLQTYALIGADAHETIAQQSLRIYPK